MEKQQQQQQQQQKKQGIGFQGRDYIIYVIEHKHGLKTISEDNRMGKVEFQKSFLKKFLVRFCSKIWRNVFPEILSNNRRTKFAEGRNLSNSSS